MQRASERENESERNRQTNRMQKRQKAMTFSTKLMCVVKYKYKANKIKKKSKYTALTNILCAIQTFSNDLNPFRIRIYFESRGSLQEFIQERTLFHKHCCQRIIIVIKFRHNSISFSFMLGSYIRARICLTKSLYAKTSLYFDKKRENQRKREQMKKRKKRKHTHCKWNDEKKKKRKRLDELKLFCFSILHYAKKYCVYACVMMMTSTELQHSNGKSKPWDRTVASYQHDSYTIWAW